MLAWVLNTPLLYEALWTFFKVFYIIKTLQIFFKHAILILLNFYCPISLTRTKALVNNLLMGKI